MRQKQVKLQPVLVSVLQIYYLMLYYKLTVIFYVGDQYSDLSAQLRNSYPVTRSYYLLYPRRDSNSQNLDPKSSAYTNSATRAIFEGKAGIEPAL